jgi:DNA-binding MarR family transcriptional regulator
MALTDLMGRARAETIDKTALGVLRIAAARNGARPTQVADELRVHPSSVTRHAQALHQAGKLAIRPDPADGRASILVPTPAGRADLWELYERGVDAFARAVADWEPNDVRLLAAGVSRLIAAIEAREKSNPDHERPQPQ